MTRPLQPMEDYPAVVVDVLASLPAALGPAEVKLSSGNALRFLEFAHQLPFLTAE